MTGKDISKITINLVIVYLVGGLLLAGVYAWTSPILYVKTKEEKAAALQKMMPLHLSMKVPGDAVAKFEELLPDEPAPVKSEAGEGLVAIDAVVDTYDNVLKKLKKRLKKSGATEIEETSGNRVEKKGDWEVWRKHAEYFEVRDGEELRGYIVETYGKGYSSYINILVSADTEFTVSKVNVLHHAETPGLGDEIEASAFKDQFRGKDLEHLEVIKGETDDKIQAITGATISTRAVTNGVRDGLTLLMEKYSSAGGAGTDNAATGESKDAPAH